VLTAVAIVALLLAAAGAWFAYDAFTRPIVATPDRAELTALDAQLTRIQDEFRPIATAFTSQTGTETGGIIDVDAYRAQVANVRDLVDSTSDLAATSKEALEIRDLVLTGGSEVVAGMNEALDALVADDPDASDAAAGHVDEGLANLQAARRLLDVLLGRTQIT
jgi:hypothetical protein